MRTFTSSFLLQTGHTQKNRTVLAPMTNSQSHEDGTLSDAELHWLELRAEGGFGMIISAASHVQPNAKAWVGQMGCFSDVHIDGLKKVAAIGKKNSALTILQLFHGGIRSPRDPADFIIGVRVLPEDAPPQKGFDIDETTKIIEWLVQLNVDYVHISGHDVAATSLKYPDSKETNLHRFRNVVPARIALIGCGGVKEAKDVEFALRQGADLVALGKTAINTPDWPLRAAEPGFVPKPFPMTQAEATAAGIAAPFMKMLKAYNFIR